MNRRIRTLIVDDETLGRQRVQALLEDEPDIEIVGTCANGEAAVVAIERLQPDLVFLDVQMPLLDGFDVIEAVGADEMPAVVFVTAYDQYAVRAFDVHALDYLLKPYDRERFQKALQRARRRLRDEPIDQLSRQFQALLVDRQAPRSEPLGRLAVKSHGQIAFVDVREIDWIEAAGNYLVLHVQDKTHLLRETMNNLETRLDPALFLRIHRSSIVQIDRIRKLELHPGGDYVFILQDGTRLPSSRSYRDAVQNLVDQAS